MENLNEKFDFYSVINENELKYVSTFFEKAESYAIKIAKTNKTKTIIYGNYLDGRKEAIKYWKLTNW